MQDKTRNTIKQVGDLLFFIGLVLSVAGIIFKAWFSIGFILLAIIGYFISQKAAPASDEPKIISPRPPLSLETLDVWALPLTRIFRQAFYICLAIIMVVFIVAFALQGYFKQRNTANKLHEIANALEHYKEEKNIYPISLNDIIGRNPLKREWKNDSWDNSIVYQSSSNLFQLISKGKDGILHTEDDIIVKN